MGSRDHAPSDDGGDKCALAAETLASLLARVEAATGPNYGLEVEVARTLGTLTYGVTGIYFPPPPYTASLDAALALVERVLPGWSWSVQHYVAGPNAAEPPLAVLIYSNGAEYAEASAEAATPALALLGALLKALIAVAGERSEPQSPRQVSQPIREEQ